jgi:hypothetical protein
LEKTVNDFIKELQALKPSLRKKPIKIYAINGLKFSPEVKIELETPGDFSKVKNLLITY